MHLPLHEDLSLHLPPTKYILTAGAVAFSLFVAFGPFRHRTPRIFTRFAKYSVGLKLMALALFAGIMFGHGLATEGDKLGDASYGIATFSLLAAATYILTRRSVGKPLRPAPPEAATPPDPGGVNGIKA